MKTVSEIQNEVEQMIAKGVVTQEELRGQLLSERLSEGRFLG